MADLVSKRAEANEARKLIDGILSVNGELTTEQVNELETADQRFKQLDAEIRQAEVVDSARASLARPTFGFKNGETPNAEKRKKSETRSFEAMLDDAGGRLLNRLGKPVEGRVYDTVTDAALVPVDLKDELIRRLPKISGAMSASTVVTEAHDNEIAAVVNRIPTAGIIAEEGAFTAAQASFQRIRFRAYKMALTSSVSVEMLQDNRVNVMAETLLQHVESYAEGWDAAYLATTNPEDSTRAAPGGLCATKAHIDAFGTDINDFVMGTGDVAVADITVEDLLAVQAAVPGRYRSGDKSWVMSPAVHAQIVQSVSADDRMIFFPQSTGTLQSDPLSVGTLLGAPIYLSDAMPAAGASAVAALYLDRRSYRVALRNTMQTLEDPYSAGSSGIVKYNSHMRADGQWTLAEASARLVYAAS
jgi:HK97 family phage major capsid protein